MEMRQAMKRKSLIIMVVLLSMTLILGVPAAYADGPIADRAGRAEVRFMEGMIDHHQMAVDMANDCLGKAETESVRTLCQTIIDKQTAEIALFQGWLSEWYDITYTPMPMTQMMEMMQGGGMMMGGMHGMMGEQMEGMDHGNIVDPPMMMGSMAFLNILTGRDYELAWLELMADHHDDAVHMSERVLEHAQHEELLQQAQQIIDDQSAEIDAIESLIAELGTAA